MIPIGMVMSADGSFDFLPEVLQKGYFDIDYRGNELVVVAGKYVGQLPLTSKVAIHVRPKMPLGNLARVVGMANQPIRCLDFFRRKYFLKGDASQTLQEGMAHSLLAALTAVDAEGIWREYVPRSSSLGGPRGRVDFRRYIGDSLARAKPTVVPSRYFEMDIDTLFNQVIKKAINQLGAALSAESIRNRDLIRRMAYFADMFDSVSDDDTNSLVERCHNSLARRHIPELRSYYLDLLDSCLIILGGSGVELIDPNGTRGMHSLVVNLEDSFESYVRAVLEAGSAGTDLKILNGNEEGRGKFFKNNKKFETKPDFVINRLGDTQILGDAKYKPKISEADRYQLVAHSLAHGARKAFLIVPAADAGKSGAEFLGSIGVHTNIDVYQYGIDLNSEDIYAEESKLQQWIYQLR